MPQHSGPPLVRTRQPGTVSSFTDNPPRIVQGILAGVGPNTDNPTFCAVYIDGRVPAQGGFRLPSGSGPILPIGTTTCKGQPFNGPYYSTDPIGNGSRA